MKTPREWAKDCIERMELAGAEASVTDVIEVIVTRAVEEATKDRDLQKSALETDLMRLMTAIGPYSTVDSAAKFATKTRQQWADLVDAARAMVKHQRDRHELSSCCHDVTPTPTYLLEKALGDMAEKLKTERPTVFCNNCGFADLIVVDGVNYRHNDPKTGRPCNYHAVPVVPDKRKSETCDHDWMKIDPDSAHVIQRKCRKCGLLAV